MEELARAHPCEVDDPFRDLLASERGHCEFARPGNRGTAQHSAAWGIKGSACAWSYWSISPLWNSDAHEMELGMGDRAHRLVFRMQDVDEVWTAKARDDAAGSFPPRSA